MRRYLVLWHRWVGLFIALFIVVAGLTGSVLAFEGSLERWLNPHLHVVESKGGAFSTVDAFALRRKAQALAPANAVVNELLLHVPAGHSALFHLTPRINHVTKQPFELLQDEMFVNPNTGELLGMREWAETPFKRETLITFLFKLHLTLALGQLGQLLFGVVAVLWTVDSFVAFFLTLPVKQKRGRRPFFNRWKPAWLIKWQGSAYRINFDMHRAIGLWLCMVFLMFAWSSVMFNLREQIYKPVMSHVFEFDNSWRGTRALDNPLERPILNWEAAHIQAKKVMKDFSIQHEFTVLYESKMRYNANKGLYAYSVHSRLDFNEGRANTAILIDANTGELKGWWLPTGGKQGNTVSNWLGALHMGHVFGLFYKIFICVMGLAVTALSATGIVIWWRKRKSRNHIDVRSAV